MLDLFKNCIGKKISEFNKIPLVKWLDGTLIAAEEGHITVEHIVQEDFVNPLGILHGGIASTFMDDVIGATVFSLGKPHYYVSLNLNVDFMSPAKLGEKIYVSAQVIRNGENIVHLEAKIANESGKLIAKATSNMAKVHKK
jgi:acyl-coenzyme A thioesterase 13